MADYYPVLKKTVAALPQNTGAARREIYQRARKAIVAQLKAYDPPLSPSDITAEQLRLEEAIRKVEAEAARATLGTSAPPPPAQTPQAQTPQAQTPPAQTASATQPTAAPPAPQPEPPEPAAPPAETAKPAPAAPAETPAGDTSSPEPAPARTASAAASASAGADTLKAAIDDARKLGTSAESAGRSARRALEGEAPVERKREPTLDTPASDTPRAEAPAKGKGAASGGSPTISTGLEGLTGDSRAPLGGTEGRPLPPLDSARPSRLPALLGGAAVLLLAIGLAAVGYSQRDALTDLFAGSDTPATTPQQTIETPDPDADEPRKDNARLLENGETAVAPDARSVTTTRITPAAPSGETPGETSAPATTPETAPADETVRAVEPETPPTPDASADPAAPPATEGPGETAETAQPADPAPGSDTAIVGQRAFLYEEGAEAGSAGQASSGRTIWDVDTETIDGRAETVLRMRVEVPDRDIVATMSLRPNRDQSLPASHLLEVRFELPEDFSGQGVAEMPGLVMKTTEEARGDALIGASVKVADGFFWVALSSIPDERERNLQLLRDRAWIDLPMLYENRKRAILTLEKGTPGTRAVEQAIAAWSAE